MFKGVLGLVLSMGLCWGVLGAQEQTQTQPPAAVVPPPASPAAEVKPLTSEEETTLENKVLKMETAARELSPEALGKAIADLIAAKQRAYEALVQDLNAYTSTIQIEGTVLNRDPKTGKFSRVKKEEVK